MGNKVKSILKKLWGDGRGVVLIVIVATVLFLAMTIQVLNNNYTLQRQIDNAKLDNQIAELENQNLKLEQEYYKTSEYQELSARALLGKAQPGEHLVLLPKVAKTATSSNDGQARTAKSNMDQWLDFLFGQHKWNHDILLTWKSSVGLL